MCQDSTTSEDVIQGNKGQTTIETENYDEC
jgi:hypothetical protein